MKQRKKSKHKFEHFTVAEPVYNRLFHIFVGKREDVIAGINKYFKINVAQDILSGGMSGCMFTLQDNLGSQLDCMWFRECNFYVIAHECFHAVFETFKRAGIPLSQDTNEAYAYYVGWIIDKIISKLSDRCEK